MRFFSFTWIFLLLVARSSVSIDHGRELQYGGDYGADSSADYSSSTYGEGDQSSTYDSTAEEDHTSATDDIPQETTPSKINFPGIFISFSNTIYKRFPTYNLSVKIVG